MAARALSLSAVAAAAFAAQRPNIIWFITDDQDLLLDSPSVMPTLQKELIGKGLHFTEGAVVSPKCCPSRTSAMSQRYPHNLNAQSLGWCGNFEAQHVNNTFVTDLQAAGYRTSLTGACLAPTRCTCTHALCILRCRTHDCANALFSSKTHLLHWRRQVFQPGGLLLRRQLACVQRLGLERFLRNL